MGDAEHESHRSHDRPRRACGPVALRRAAGRRLRRRPLDKRTFEVAGTVDGTGTLTLTGRTLPDPLVPCLQVTSSNLRLAGNQITGSMRRVTYGNPNCTGGGTASSNGTITLTRS